MSDINADPVGLVKVFCREASENVMNEMRGTELYTLTDYLNQLHASSLVHSGVCLTFDQINDLLCAQTANTLREVARHPYALPSLSNALQGQVNTLNAARESYGRGAV